MQLSRHANVAHTCLLTKILLAVGADLKVMPLTLVERSSVVPVDAVKLQLPHNASRSADGALPVLGQMLDGSDGDGTPVRRLRRLT